VEKAVKHSLKKSKVKLVSSAGSQAYIKCLALERRIISTRSNITKTRKNAIVDCLDYQIPVNQLMGNIF